MNALVPPWNEGIGFGTSSGSVICFSEPALLGSVAFGKAPGIYAVVVPDSSCGPRQFKVLYFGMTNDLSSRPSRNHENFDSWCNEGMGERNLYVCCYEMRGSGPLERAMVESSLIRHYNPPCNKTSSDSANPYPAKTLADFLAPPPTPTGNALWNQLWETHSDSRPASGLAEAFRRAKANQARSTSLGSLLGSYRPDPPKRFKI